MNLVEAIHPAVPARIALVGAGGKTTALFQLACQIEGLVWVTTTTHLGADQVSLADRHFVVQTNDEFIVDRFKQQKVSLITGPFTQDDRASGLPPNLLEQLYRSSANERVSVLIEADGSRSIPLKAPAADEPPIPAWVTHVIVVVGLSALRKPFTSQWVFRPDEFSRLTAISEGEPIAAEHISEMLIHPQGGLKNIPLQARKIVLLNQADTGEIQSIARQMISKLLNGGFDQVIIGSVGKAPQSLEGYPHS
ncbi:MAG: selenium cofactor biosynthesis protein YqeC [Anaerolineaceae bacterium]